VASVYLATWDSLDVPLQPLRDRGWVQEADAAYAAMSALTGKRLTQKNPTMPTEDAVANWDRLRPILADVARLYLDTE
jgi:hypothetical protein